MILILLCACGQKPQKTEFIEGIHYPPSVTVEYGGNSFKATGGTYSWNYDDDDGSNTAVDALGENPLEIKDIAHFSAGNEKTAKLIFGKGFNKCFISRWKVEEDYLEKEFLGYDWMGENEEPVEHENGVFEVPTDGTYIYEVWVWYESGDAQYSFRIDPADEWGITLSVKDVTNTGATVVFSQSGGNPNGELNTGSWYCLEYEGKEMEFIVEGDVAWTAEAYMIPKDSEIEMKVNWEWLYGTLEPGEYIIRKEVMDFRGPGDYDKKGYSAKFVVE